MTYFPDHLPFAYLRMRSKASRYLEVGPAAYRSGDAFLKPDTCCTSEELATLEAGMRQIIDFRGLRPDTPLQGLQIAGFRLLADTLHCRVCGQQIVKVSGGLILDRMVLSHLVMKDSLTLYNEVAALPPDEDEPAPHAEPA